MSEKQRFMSALEKEFPTTLKVLKAFPATKADFKPHRKCRSAKELAWTFVLEQGALRGALAGGIDFKAMGTPAPATLQEVIATYEKVHRDNVEALKKASDADLNQTVKFPTGPGQMGDWRRMDFLWFLLMDCIHHRGQFSVYLRMADGKVPSIYGPSADEPWM